MSLHSNPNSLLQPSKNGIIQLRKPLIFQSSVQLALSHLVVKLELGIDEIQQLAIYFFFEPILNVVFGVIWIEEAHQLLVCMNALLHPFKLHPVFSH